MVYIILIQIKTLTENYDQILHKNTLIKIYDHMLHQSTFVVHLHQSIQVNMLHKSAFTKFLHQKFSAQKWVNPYRNENVAALELQYCGSSAAIKF